MVFKDLIDNRTGGLIVPDGVSELFKLIEYNDAITTVLTQFPALVVNFLDVGFRPRCSDDLIGAKIGCNEAECGICTVLVNGIPVVSCSYPAFKASGAKVETIEGTS